MTLRVSLHGPVQKPHCRQAGCQGRQVLSLSEISLVPYLDLTSDWLLRSHLLYLEPRTTPLWWQMVFLINNKVNICNQLTVREERGELCSSTDWKYQTFPTLWPSSHPVNSNRENVLASCGFYSVYFITLQRPHAAFLYDLMTWWNKDTSFTASRSFINIFPRITRSFCRL